MYVHTYYHTTIAHSECVPQLLDVKCASVREALNVQMLLITAQELYSINVWLLHTTAATQCVAV